MADFKVEVKGLRELDAALRKLPPAMQAKPMRDALKDAGEVLRSGAARRAPRDPIQEGVTLAEEILSRVVVSELVNVAKVQVGPSTRAFYGGFQELGWTQPDGKFNPGHPYLRPTLDADGGAAIFVLTESLRDSLPQEIKRVAYTVPS